MHLKESQRLVKTTQLPYVTFGGKFKTRKDDMMITASGLICIDLDDVGEVDSLKEELIKGSPLLVLLFVSPMGKGLKLVFRCNPNFSFKENYKQLSLYLVNEFEIGFEKIDQSCATISKACFLCYDPNVYLNPSVTEDKGVELIPILEDIHFQNSTSKTPQVNPQAVEDENSTEFNLFELSSFKYHPIKFNYEKPNTIENLIQLCRLNNRDFGELKVGKRHTWFLKLAMLCNSFGMKKESAIKHCHTLFDNHPAIVDKENLFDNTNDLLKPFESVYEKFADDFGLTKENNEEWQTPLIPDDVYNRLPRFIKKLTDLFDKDKRERDVLFLGLITLLSTLFPKVRGKYNNRLYRSNLFLFTAAPAASGKGVLSFIRTCGEKIHAEFLDEYRIALKEYNSAPEEQKKEMTPPVMKKLFIPANSTYASIIKCIEANRVFGMVMDTEADTMAVANKSEHGNFSVVFRKLFEHETIDYERKSTKEYFSIDYPACSIIISGTPKQINRLISDTENGFTSRFLFYCYVAKIKWKDVFEDGPDYEYIFKSVATELYSLVRPYLNDFLDDQESDIRFALTKEQGKKLNSWFSGKLDELTHIFGADISSSVKRLGVIHFRLAMILTIMRKLESIDPLEDRLPENIICSDEDFEIAHAIIGTLLHHTVKVFQQLQSKSTFKNHRLKKDIFLEKLPNEFDYAKAKEVANYLSLNQNTAENYLRIFVTSGKLEKIGHNQYKKAQQ
ncbi:MAG TPA: DUF3987 domain-containing protein [Ferruginibacter sp.]|nr:DUF3987 domain-containing protein [Ferruginibacter sp.]